MTKYVLFCLFLVKTI
jgi:hypothetical protein